MPMVARVEVTWGDCDPAGIVFYPRYFAWMDQASHLMAREMGVAREAMLPPTGDVGFPIVGARAQFFMNQIVHIWVYEDAADRAKRRAAMQADPDWQAYLKKSAEAGYLENQVTKLMLPVKFAPIAKP